MLTTNNDDFLLNISTFLGRFDAYRIQGPRIEEKTNHTFNLSFLLHGQDFRKPNFTLKKTTKDTKNTKNFSEKSQMYAVFSPNLEKFTPDRNFLHRHRL